MNKVTAAILILLSCVLSPVLWAEAVWIDVRSKFEHMMDSIEGDRRIPHDDIVAEVSKLYPKKNTEIYLYCASGVRSGKATKALKAAGYTDVSNAGGIDDARARRDLDR